MKPFDCPKSKTADICLILEGTYPFLPGGVANWVDELIKFFPEYKFAAIFLGTSKEDYTVPFYPLRDNLVHLEVHYLFDTKEPRAQAAQEIDKKTFEKITSMHEKFKDITSDELLNFPEIYDLMEEKAKPERNQFLRSKLAWDYITEQYYDRYSTESFFEYFWTIRSLHRPFWALKKVANHVPKFKIIHSASTGYAGFLGALLQKKYDIPYVLTEHGIYTKERWIEVMRASFFKQTKKKTIGYVNEDVMLDVWIRFFKMLGKISYTRSDPIISLTEEYRQRQITDGAIPERTRIISYGIDFEHYKFLDKDLNEKKPIVAIVARVVPIKDVKTFIRAAAIVIQQVPHAEAWIIGGTDEDPAYASACESLVTTLGLEKKIKFLGVQKMTEMYPKLDVLVLTSISEGSPFVMLECLAVGIPMVSTDVGGCGELINGKNDEDKALGPAGGLVQIADPKAVAEAVIPLITNKTTWKKAQQSGLKRVRKYYGMNKLIEIYGNIYKEALKNGGNRV